MSTKLSTNISQSMRLYGATWVKDTPTLVGGLTVIPQEDVTAGTALCWIPVPGVSLNISAAAVATDIVIGTQLFWSGTAFTNTQLGNKFVGWAMPPEGEQSSATLVATGATGSIRLWMGYSIFESADLHEMLVDEGTYIHLRTYFKITDAGDVTILAASTHPKMKLVQAVFELSQVPDATADTLIAQIFAGASTGGTDMTDAVTMTQGTDVVGSWTKFTIDGTDHTILATVAAILKVSGISTTLGAGVCDTTWQVVD